MNDHSDANNYIAVYPEATSMGNYWAIDPSTGLNRSFNATVWNDFRRISNVVTNILAIMGYYNAYLLLSEVWYCH